MEKSLTVKLESNIWKSYIFQILAKSTAFFLPIIVLFWQDYGLSLMQIMVLQSIFSIAVILLEIPSGYFADVHGRKKSLLYSAISLSISMLIFSVSSSFFYFLLAEIFLAAGVSFLSGADAALVYDTLRDLKKEKDFKKVWGNTVFYFIIGMVAFNIIGGIVGNLNFRFTFYMALGAMLLLIPIALSFQEPKSHKIINRKGYIKELIRIVKYSLIQNKKLRWVILYSAVISTFIYAALYFYQPYFILSGLEIVYFGVVFAVFNVIAAISSKYAHRIEKIFGERYSLMLLFILLGGSYLLMGNFIYLFSFLFAFLQQFVRGYYLVVITDYINKMTKSSIRATVLSVQSMFASLVYALAIPLFGWVADVYSLSDALIVIGVTVLVSGLAILAVLAKEKVI